ncbi:hypothetical protein FHE74_09510 [Corynebacterium tapiri]|uniref:Uncharacterized protein n=1 Tax=Corynebacterium tapiri TaxID=1448266 RepID=A0A5C4U1F6_9CORY|nr:hypothetical protein FHE74_09510 [Corynebacterium tapiri]
MEHRVHREQVRRRDRRSGRRPAGPRGGAAGRAGHRRAADRRSLRARPRACFLSPPNHYSQPAFSWQEHVDWRALCTS